MASLLQFVSSIDEEPTVRLDLNDGTKWGMLAETVFPPPPLKQAIASTLLTDGAVIPASAYDLRLITLALTLKTGTADDTAAELQKLHRELNRPTNILRWREHTTEPVFFRTFRNSAQAVDRYGQFDGRKNHISVEIPAEPFAYGLPVDLGEITVNNDPAHATNPTYFDVEDVLGDVDAPMRIKKHGHGGGTLAVLTVNAWSTRRRGDPDDVPYLLQAESMTQGTDTSVQPNDTDMSGSGDNFSRCTFGTATLERRLRQNAWPTSPSVGARGVYRVFGRFRKSVAGDTVRVQLRVGGPGSLGDAAVSLPEVTLPNTTGLRHIDLGLVQLPVGVRVDMNGPSGEILAAEGMRVELWAARDSGSGNLDIDYLIFVPADDRLAFTELTDTWQTSADSGVVFDSHHDALYVHRDTGDLVVNNGIGQVTGSLPMLRPGVTNRVWYLDAVGPAIPSLRGVSRTFEVSYWPRYLSIRPDDIPAP